MGLFHKKVVLVTLSGNTVVQVHNKKEAYFYAEQFLKHCYESKDLVNKTKTPRVFFERYDFLLTNTENLAELEYFLKFKGQKPSKTLIYLNEIRENETNTTIERVWDNFNKKFLNLKTKKGKETATNNLFNEFKPFIYAMTKSNIDLCTSYYDTFISRI